VGLTAGQRRYVSAGITVALLATALVADRLMARPDTDRELASELVDDPVEVEVRDGVAYRGRDAVVLPFDVQGQQARIRGAVVVAGDSIEQVVVTHSSEGIDRRALFDTEFLDSFRGRRADRTVVVDAVTGATISSFTLMRAVADRLRAWREVNE
jgi:uncharacterized protein with FMN-binding domain